MVDLRDTTTDDQADWAMLKHADNVRGILAVQSLEPLVMGTPTRTAFDRGVDYDWFRLIDVHAGGRIFKLTNIGRERLRVLKEKFSK